MHAERHVVQKRARLLYLHRPQPFRGSRSLLQNLCVYPRIACFPRLILHMHILQALKLNEIPYKFKGPLPDLEIDENHISCKGDTWKKKRDPLEKDDESQALCLQPGKIPSCIISLRPCYKVRISLSSHISRGTCFGKSWFAWTRPRCKSPIKTYSSESFCVPGTALRAHSALAEHAACIQNWMCDCVQEIAKSPQPPLLPRGDVHGCKFEQRDPGEVDTMASTANVQEQHKGYKNQEAFGNRTHQKQMFAEQHRSHPPNAGRSRRKKKEEERCRGAR